MGAAEINRQIRKLKNKKEELKELKTKYENMNKKIIQATESLYFAKAYTEESYVGLESNYKSQVSEKKANELKDEYDNINNIIKLLENDIIEESNARISQIKKDIERIDEEISDLEEELENMEE